MKSKHYAFLEFEDPEVARIAAAAMNGYMMFGRTLVCQVVSDDKIHEKVMKGSWRSAKKFSNCYRATVPSKDVRTKATHDRRIHYLLASNQRKRMKLIEAGIDCEFAQYSLPMQESA